MRNLSLRELINAVVDGVQSTLLISQAEQGRPLGFMPVESWGQHGAWGTSLEAMMIVARKLQRSGEGPPSMADLQTFVDAAAAAERTAAVLALCPHDQDPMHWFPAGVASYRMRSTRALFVESRGILGNTRWRVLNAHPQVAEAAAALGMTITERALPIPTTFMLQGADTVRTIAPVIVGDLRLTRQILTVESRIVGTEQAVSPTAGGVL